MLYKNLPNSILIKVTPTKTPNNIIKLTKPLLPFFATTASVLCSLVALVVSVTGVIVVVPSKGVAVTSVGELQGQVLVY